MKVHFRILLGTILILLLASCSSVSESQIGNTPTSSSNLPFEMRPFTTEMFGYVLDIPSDWENVVGVEARCENAPVCFVSDNDQILIIYESNIGDVGGEGMTLSEYLDVLIPTYGDGSPGYEFVSRQQFENNIGQYSEIITYTLYEGAVMVKQLWFAEDGNAINVLYMGFEEDYDEIEEMVEYSFNSLRE